MLNILWNPPGFHADTILLSAQSVNPEWLLDSNPAPLVKAFLPNGRKAEQKDSSHVLATRALISQVRHLHCSASLLWRNYFILLPCQVSRDPTLIYNGEWKENWPGNSSAMDESHLKPPGKFWMTGLPLNWYWFEGLN
jgi:hypothetical protein